MASIWFVSAAHGRYPTTRVALKQRRHVCDELAARGHTADCVIVADDENLDIADEHGFAGLEMDNTDVGAKFNAGIAYAYNQGADTVVYIGSDNWAHIDLFDRLPQLRQVMTRSLLQVVDVPTGRMRTCRVDTNWGVIPWFITRHLLEKSGAAPIEAGLKRGFDGALIRGLTRALGYPPTFVRFDPHEYACVDWKTRDNITPYEQLDKQLGIGGTQDPWETLTGWYPEEVIAFAKETFA